MSHQSMSFEDIILDKLEDPRTNIIALAAIYGSALCSEGEAKINWEKINTVIDKKWGEIALSYIIEYAEQFRDETLILRRKGAIAAREKRMKEIEQLKSGTKPEHLSLGDYEEVLEDEEDEDIDSIYRS